MPLLAFKMKSLIVKILPCLFIFMLMIPSVLSGRLPMQNKSDNNARTLGTKNSSEEDHNHYFTGIRRAVPAPQLPDNIFLDPYQECYKQFFANGQPPVGLRTANLQNMRYICQQVPTHPGTFFYATMFDEGRGVPVYSAYVLNASNVDFVAQRAESWLQTNGIQHQGSDSLYKKQPCQRGHLFPAMTASGLPRDAQNPLNAANSARSTYQYTNAVPQCGSFNGGEWRSWEGKVRQKALECTAAPSNGVMYLITGVSFVGITDDNPPQPVEAEITPFPSPPRAPNPPNPPVNPDAIDQPNSMWTMGQCVPQNGQAQSFAVIGNNVPNKAEMLTKQITEQQLYAILQVDITTNGLKRSGEPPKVSLFPGVKHSRPITLPTMQYPPPENETPASPPRQPPSPRKPSSPKNPKTQPIPGGTPNGPTRIPSPGRGPNSSKRIPSPGRGRRSPKTLSVPARDLELETPKTPDKRGSNTKPS